MEKLKVGQKVTYIPHNQVVEVIYVTPYHDSDDKHAVNFIKTKNGIIMPVPVAVQDKYLSTAPPVKTSVVKKIFGGKA